MRGLTIYGSASMQCQVMKLPKLTVQEEQDSCISEYHSY